MKKLEVCRKCPLNSKNNKTKKTIKEKIFIFSNKLLNKIFSIKREEEEICLDCGCDILFKTSDEIDEDLHCKKWK